VTCLDRRRNGWSWNVCKPLVEGLYLANVIRGLQHVLGVISMERVNECLLEKGRVSPETLASERANESMPSCWEERKTKTSERGV
jgi:hypothetical protein